MKILDIKLTKRTQYRPLGEVGGVGFMSNRQGHELYIVDIDFEIGNQRFFMRFPQYGDGVVTNMIRDIRNKVEKYIGEKLFEPYDAINRLRNE